MASHGIPCRSSRRECDRDIRQTKPPGGTEEGVKNAFEFPGFVCLIRPRSAAASGHCWVALWAIPKTRAHDASQTTVPTCATDSRVDMALERTVQGCPRHCWVGLANGTARSRFNEMVRAEN